MTSAVKGMVGLTAGFAVSVGVSFAHDLTVFAVLEVRRELDGTTRSGVETHHRVVVCNESSVTDPHVAMRENRTIHLLDRQTRRSCKPRGRARRRGHR